MEDIGFLQKYSKLDCYHMRRSNNEVEEGAESSTKSDWHIDSSYVADYGGFIPSLYVTTRKLDDSEHPEYTGKIYKIVSSNDDSYVINDSLFQTLFRFDHEGDKKYSDHDTPKYEPFIENLSFANRSNFIKSIGVLYGDVFSSVPVSFDEVADKASFDTILKYILGEVKTIYDENIAIATEQDTKISSIVKENLFQIQQLGYKLNSATNINMLKNICQYPLLVMCLNNGIDKQHLQAIITKEIAENPSLNSAEIVKSTTRLVSQLNDLILLANFPQNITYRMERILDPETCGGKMGAKMKDQVSLPGLNGKNQIIPRTSVGLLEKLMDSRVVGVRFLAQSGTTRSGEPLDQISLYDLDHMMTQQDYVAHRKELESFNGLSDLIGNGLDHVKKINNVQKFNAVSAMVHGLESEKYYEYSAGVWEGFTIGEHTETTETFFDEHYKQDFPELMQTLIKTTLLIHDGSKGYAFAHSPLSNEEADKIEYSILKELNVDIKTSKLIKEIIKAQQFTSRYYVKQDKSALNDLYNYLKTSIKTIYDIQDPKEQDILSLMKVCEIVQSCDSGAYTLYGITHKDGQAFYNSNVNFTNSFEQKKTSSEKSRENGEGCKKPSLWTKVQLKEPLVPEDSKCIMNITFDDVTGRPSFHIGDGKTVSSRKTLSKKDFKAYPTGIEILDAETKTVKFYPFEKPLYKQLTNNMNQNMVP